MWVTAIVLNLGMNLNMGCANVNATELVYYVSGIKLDVFKVHI